MLVISYLYPCGHTEEEVFDTEAVVCELDGSICEQMQEQMVVMARACVNCELVRDEPCELALEENELEEDVRWREVVW